LYNLLMTCSNKDDQNYVNDDKKKVCRYLDMFMKSPIICHGKVLADFVEI
jgi:hypothetical protein